jgi:hypothetical protein
MSGLIWSAQNCISQYRTYHSSNCISCQFSFEIVYINEVNFRTVNTPMYRTIGSGGFRGVGVGTSPFTAKTVQNEVN